MPKHDRQFSKEVILEHIDAIESYRPESKDAFLRDARTYDAILMRLVAIGEELSMVRQVLEDKEPQLEWHRIIGVRNRISHGYWEVDKDVVWELLTDGSLDQLRNALR
jgi:uncharacterized protein with HEPN domain